MVGKQAAQKQANRDGEGGGLTGSGGRSHGDRGQDHHGQRDQAHRQPQLDAEAFGEGAAREVRAEIEA